MRPLVVLLVIAAANLIGASPVEGAGTRVSGQPSPSSPAATYAGSATCRTCHAEVYDRWVKTRMANVVRDPRTHPDAIIPNLSTPNPLVTFTKDDIALVYGSKWKQRYFTKSATTTIRSRRSGT